MSRFWDIITYFPKPKMARNLDHDHFMDILSCHC